MAEQKKKKKMHHPKTKMVTIGEAVQGRGGWKWGQEGVCGSSLYVLLHFPVNLKLL